MDNIIGDTLALDSGLPSAPQHANGPATATTLEKGTSLPSLSYQTTIARDLFYISRSMIVHYTSDDVPLHLREFTPTETILSPDDQWFHVGFMKDLFPRPSACSRTSKAFRCFPQGQFYRNYFDVVPVVPDVSSGATFRIPILSKILDVPSSSFILSFHSLSSLVVVCLRSWYSPLGTTFYPDDAQSKEDSSKCLGRQSGTA